MKVKDLSLRPLLSIRPEDDLGEAARTMTLNGADCLLVMSGNRRVGIITESDLVRAMAAGLGPLEARVADFMSSDPATVDPGEPAGRAAARMRAIGCDIWQWSKTESPQVSCRPMTSLFCSSRTRTDAEN
jgi:CBS domain-containing protein